MASVKPPPPPARPEDPPGGIVQAVVAVVLAGLGAPSLLDNTAKAPRWAMITGGIICYLLAVFFACWSAYARGRKSGIASTTAERDAEKTRADSAEKDRGEARQKLTAAEMQRAAAETQSAAAATQLATLRSERDTLQNERDGLKTERDTLKAERDDFKATRDGVTAALGASNLNDPVAAIGALKDDRRTAKARVSELESALTAFDKELGLGVELAQVASAIKAERESALAASKSHNEQINKAIQDTIDAEKKREPKDIVAVRMVVIPTDEHGFVCNGLPFPHGKVTVRFGLMATNYGRRGFVPRELYDIQIAVYWSGDVANAGAGFSVGTRLIRNAPYIAPGGCDVLFYKSEPIDVPMQFSPPHPWSPNGTMEIAGSLAVAIGDVGDPNPEIGSLGIDVAAPITFTLSRQTVARAAATTIMNALNARNIEKEKVEEIIQTAVASINEACK